MAHVDFDLVDGAIAAMVEHGFHPSHPPEVEAEVEAMPSDLGERERVKDLRSLPWSSIDNDESKDLDQIEVVEDLDGGDVRLRVAIADVDALVPRGSRTDRHAADNTTSVYTSVVVFPMLPDRLSTELTSLLEGQDRLAMVTEMVVASDGTVRRTSFYRARVRNHAKLTYDEVGAWLEGAGPRPRKLVEMPELEAQLRIQDETAQRLRARRYERGALDLETIEARAVARDGHVVDLRVEPKSRSRELIEDLMIAANAAMARFLEDRGVRSIRRVVRSPERWQRIVGLAAEHGVELPAEPSAKALSDFLRNRRAAAPEQFADLSLSVVKLMGPGEYTLEPPPGDITHFGLAVQDYTHSTAPNRRFSDLVTQRLVKAALEGRPTPYDDRALAAIAQRCTDKENDAKKVERTTRKQAAAMLLHDRLGEEFEAIVTGVTPKGTFVRLLHPPAEGRVVRGEQGMDVAERVRVRLLETSPAKGFIDFARA